MKLRFLIACAVAITIGFGGWLLFNKSNSNVIAKEDSQNSRSRETQAIERARSEKKPSLENPSALPSPNSLKVAIDAIHKTKACYASTDCPFPQQDPRAYEHAVGQALAKQLREIRDRFKSTPEAQIELEKLGREFFENQDGFVQSEALAMLADLPPSSENLAAITTAMENSPDPLLVEKSMTELKRYLGTAQESQVHQSLTQVMSAGSHFASQSVAKALIPFINSNSYSAYSKAAATLPPDTTTAKLLKSALDEYQMQQTGG